MDAIQKLFAESGCSGCPILEVKKPYHSYLDEELEEAPILFISDSLKTVNGFPNALRGNERDLIRAATHFIKEDIEVTASVKCPSVREVDMTPTAQNICRKYLSDSIDKVKPQLVFPMGNLAMKMLTKKSGSECVKVNPSLKGLNHLLIIRDVSSYLQFHSRVVCGDKVPPRKSYRLRSPEERSNIINVISWERME